MPRVKKRAVVAMADVWSRMLDESGLGELAMESGLPLPTGNSPAPTADAELQRQKKRRFEEADDGDYEGVMPAYHHAPVFDDDRYAMREMRRVVCSGRLTRVFRFTARARRSASNAR